MSQTTSQLDRSNDDSDEESVLLTTYNRGDGFIQPLNNVWEIINNIYDGKRKIKIQELKLIKKEIYEMKDRIINKVTSGMQEQKQESTTQANLLRQEQLSQVSTQHKPTTRPIKPSYASVTKSAPKRAAVIMKTSLKTDNHPNLNSIEKSVAETLQKQQVNATIHSVKSTRNGDVLLLFDEKDDVKRIADNISNELEIESHGRPPILPKITITHVPSYVNLKDQVKSRIMEENRWLRTLVEENETFDVLFTYKKDSLGSIVCKVSPKIRQLLIERANYIKIAMRSCPVKDRFHITRCGKCMKYGHKRTECKSSTFVCGFCSQSHDSTLCEVKDLTEQHKCICCESASLRSDHNAFNPQCNIFLRKQEQLIRNTNWGDAQIPST